MSDLNSLSFDKLYACVVVSVPVSQGDFQCFLEAIGPLDPTTVIEWFVISVGKGDLVIEEAEENKTLTYSEIPSAFNGKKLSWGGDEAGEVGK